VRSLLLRHKCVLLGVPVISGLVNHVSLLHDIALILEIVQLNLLLEVKILFTVPVHQKLQFRLLIHRRFRSLPMQRCILRVLLE
jgi:hypothetical protein